MRLISRQGYTDQFARYRLVALSAGFAAALIVPDAMGQRGKPPEPARYETPPKAIADLIDAPLTPAVSTSPDRAWMVLLEQPAYPPIDELSQPELRLAGLRINPRTNGRSREWAYKGLTFKRISDGDSVPSTPASRGIERAVTGLPDDPRITGVRWSPDSNRIAFAMTRENGLELWIAEVDSGKAKKLTDATLNATLGIPYDWVSDSKTLLVRLVPEGRGAAPPEPLVPAGPIVQENIGRTAPARTYQDLLKNTHDEALFDHYMTSRVAAVRITGEIKPNGSPGIIADVSPSPDGKNVFVRTVVRPYSYIVPVFRFAHRAEIWDFAGNLVRRVADNPVADEVPVDFSAVPTGPRSFSWRADAPNTLCWVEAQDGGDPKRPAEVRDKLVALSAPFKGEPTVLASTELRYGGVRWGSENLALVSESWWQNRKTRTWVVDPSAPEKSPVLLFDRSFEDRYADPGSPVMTESKYGTSVLMTADGDRSIFLSGQGASPDGDRPFLDRMKLESRETKRLFHSQSPHYESVAAVLDPDAGIVLTRRESITEPPNYFVRNLSDGRDRALTDFPHPTPQLVGVYKEMIQYERADGVKLTGTLYLPPGKKPEDGPFPLLMWAYPQEFKSADAAGQVTDSPYRFVRTSPMSPLLWLMHGYAILDDPSLPIVGEGEAEPNDTYVEQLVAGARAAVDEVVRRGVADRDRIAIGGHSYGAFMTANLLAHCDLFRAGIARSGAYNRTLTPFSFQAEQRTFWQAPETYINMSPFSHAEKIKHPILLIHGEADNNSGTFPMQSERFYAALKGHGATTRLVMLPHESHGYRARESLLHAAWETTRWLDIYVKNAPTREKSADDAPRAGTQ